MRFTSHAIFRIEFYHSPALISTGFANLRRYNISMKTVYLDELFFLNLVIDYFLLLAAAKLCALPFRRLRFAGAAALGAFWCCVSLLPEAAFLRLPVMHILLGVLMTLAAFGAEKNIFRCFFAFLGVSALFGGAVYAAGLYRGISSAGLIMRLDLRVLALSFALCWAVVELVLRRSARNSARTLRQITLERRGKTVSFLALEDTGNDLYDGLTGCGALVAEADVVSPLFPELPPGCLRGSAADAVLNIPGARLLPYADVSGKTRLLLAFRPDGVIVDGEPRGDLIAAVAPGSLGGGGSYHGLI